MAETGRFHKSHILLFLIVLVVCSHLSPAEDKKLTPEALIAKHLQSIGSPDLLAKTKSREFVGTASVRFVQGAVGEMSGQGQFASEEDKLGIILRYPGQDYRGEHFAFDGKDVTVGRYLPGKISILAEFVERFGDVIKKGLLGGALNIDWPARTLQEMKARLKYNKVKLAGRQVHALEYRPGGGLEGFKIVLYFDSETFHHIRTEYKLRITAAMGSGSAASIGVERSDSYYLLSEEFADFKEIDGLTLPQRYTIGFSSEGGTRTFVAYWTLEAKQWVHNGKIDSDVFTAPKY